MPAVFRQSDACLANSIRKVRWDKDMCNVRYSYYSYRLTRLFAWPCQVNANVTDVNCFRRERLFEKTTAGIEPAYRALQARA